MEELDEAAEQLGLDLEEPLALEQWQKVMRGMGMCEHEAADMYSRVKVELEADGESTKDGIPLVEFMDDLQIDSEDIEGLRHVKRAVDSMKSGALDVVEKSTCGLDIAIDKIVRLLDLAHRPPEDGWEVAMAAPELSAAGRRLIQATYA